MKRGKLKCENQALWITVAGTLENGENAQHKATTKKKSKNQDKKRNIRITRVSL